MVFVHSCTISIETAKLQTTGFYHRLLSELRQSDFHPWFSHTEHRVEILLE